MAGKPLRDVEETTSLLADTSSVEPLLADDSQRILNDADFNDYRVFIPRSPVASVTLSVCVCLCPCSKRKRLELSIPNFVHFLFVLGS